MFLKMVLYYHWYIYCINYRNRTINQDGQRHGSIIMTKDLKKILIVDDEPLILFGLSKTFGDIAEVKTVRTGEEACEELAASNYDLCILDIYLPGMSGMEVLERIKQTPPWTKVMIMTAYADDQIKRQVRKITPYFFEKPFKLSEIREIVKKSI